MVREYIPWIEKFHANELSQNTYGYKILSEHFDKIIEFQRAMS